MEGRRKKEIWEVGRLEVVYNNPTLLPRTRTGVTSLCGPYLQIKEVAANVPLLETKIRDNYFKLKPFQHKKIDEVRLFMQSVFHPLFCFFKPGCYFVAQAGLELTR